MKKQTAVFFFVSFVLFIISGRAEILSVKTYTAADGLGSSFISYLMTDTRGFLWFATRDGLSRFDGQQFTTYRVGAGDAPPGIEQIIETKRGIYWIVAANGIYRYDPQTAAPAPPSPNNDRTILNAEFISDKRGEFYEDKTGNLWFFGGSLNLVTEKNGEIVFNEIELSLPANASIPFNIVDLMQASDGSFWIATSWGLVRRLPTGKDVFYGINSPLTDFLTMVLEDAAGKIWLARSSSIYVIKPEKIEELSEFSALSVRFLDEIALTKTDRQPILPGQSGEIFKFTAIEGLSDSPTKLLYKSNDDHIWISTAGGIIEYDGFSFRYLTGTQGITGSYGQIIEDSNYNLWVGGYKGLQRIDRNGLTTFDAVNGLKSSHVIIINETAGGDLYVADPNFLISRFDGERFAAVRPPIPPSAGALWTSNPVYLDSRNEWWILTAEKLYRLAAPKDFTALAQEKPLGEYDRRDGLKGNQLYRIFEDRQNNIWVSTRAAAGGSDFHGLSKFNRADETFYTFSEAENFPSGKSPSAFAEDAHGNLWIGLYEGGLLRFRDGRFVEIVANEMPKGVITSLHLDKKGRLWMATALSGVSRIDDLTAADLKFVAYTTAVGLTSNNARSLTEDDFGRIYVGTARGVDRITIETGQIKHYTTNDGLAGDFVQTAFRAKDGALWFGTTNGLSRLVPRQETKTVPPPVWLSGLRIAGESQNISELGASEIANLELAPAQNNLQIDFFAIDYKASDSLRYQYKLEGADLDWSAPTDQRTVNYANLSAGDYRFLVRAVGADGGESANPAAVTFRILRPVWQRWWFLMLSIFIIGFLIYSLYRYRVAQLLKVERVRTRIATDLHDDIGASLSKIAILSEVANHQIAPTAAKNPQIGKSLTDIADTSREMVDSMADIVWAINPERDRLSDLTGRMRNLASEMTELADIGLRVNLVDLEDRDFPLGADLRREIYLIFKETINNLVKHSKCERVEVEFRLAGDEFIFTVKDDGRGFEVEKLNGDSNGNGGNSRRGGNGLTNMRRRAANLGGSYEITSKINGGTISTLRVPVKHNFKFADYFSK